MLVAAREFVRLLKMQVYVPSDLKIKHNFEREKYGPKLFIFCQQLQYLQSLLQNAEKHHRFQGRLQIKSLREIWKLFAIVNAQKELRHTRNSKIHYRLR